MDSSSSEITHDFPPFLRVFKDGRVERLMGSDYVPPTVDPTTGVETKDVVISPETGVTVRIFKPRINSPDQKKLPLLVHYHGGGFCVGSALDSGTVPFVTSVVSKADVVAVSVDYRLAPEHPMPIAYDDSWSALQWISTHSNSQGPDPWLNQYVDFGRVFLTGESAGANIAHHVAVRAGATGLDGLRVYGLIIVHPFFADKEPYKMIQYLYPGSSGTEDDPKLNPKGDPDLEKMSCSKVLVVVAEIDWWKPRGVAYWETLKNSGWKGELELLENKGEDHCFHVFNPTSENTLLFVQKLASFINQD